MTIDELRAAVIEAAKKQLEALERTAESPEPLWLMATNETESAARALADALFSEETKREPDREIAPGKPGMRIVVHPGEGIEYREEPQS